MPVQGFHPDYTAWEDRWQRITDATKDSDAVKCREDKYLPVLPGQDRAYPVPNSTQTIDQYRDIYLRYAVFLPYARKVMNGLLGLLFRKTPAAEGLGIIEPHMHNITLTGSTLAKFAKSVAREYLRTSWGGVLVDYSERAQRPYQRLYRALHFRDWEFEDLGGVPHLVQARLTEHHRVANPDGWGSQDRERIRVLQLLPLPAVDALLEKWAGQRPDGFGRLSDESTYPFGVYVQRLFGRELDKDGGETEHWVEIEPPKVPMRSGRHIWFIPFQPLSEEPGAPPLLDVVDLNLAHFINSADYRSLLNKFGHPTMMLTGFREEKDHVRVGGIIQTSLTDADGKYLELSGGSASELRAAMKELKDEMAIVAARMLLAEQKKAAETVESQEFRMAGDDATLSDVAADVSDVLTNTSIWHRWWHGTEKLEAIEKDLQVSLNREFFRRTLSVADLQTLMMIWMDGGMTTELYEKIKYDGGFAREGVTWEQEMEDAQRQARERAPRPAPLFDDADAV